MNTVVATVESIAGTCPFHKVGDQIKFDGHHIDGYFCASAMVMLMPNFYALRYGAQLPFMTSGRCTLACPDPINLVTFRITLVPEPEHK